eukprot:sb/3473196/
MSTESHYNRFKISMIRSFNSSGPGGLRFGDCPDLIHLHRGLHWQVCPAAGAEAYHILHWGGELHSHTNGSIAVLVVHQHPDPLITTQCRVRLYLERCFLQVPGYIHILLYCCPLNNNPSCLQSCNEPVLVAGSHKPATERDRPKQVNNQSELDI